MHCLPLSQLSQWKCRGGLILKVSTCMQTSHWPIQGWVSISSRVGGVLVFGTLCQLKLQIALGPEGACPTHLGGGFGGLVFRLVCFHTSAIGLKLQGWNVIECQKHGSIDIANSWWLGFFLKRGMTCLQANLQTGSSWREGGRKKTPSWSWDRKFVSPFVAPPKKTS